MSNHGFHVHGPHDHELEAVSHEEGQEHNSSMNNQIAMFTAVIATVGALFGYMDGTTLVNSSAFKNNAAISKTEAANQWNYYQSKSNKQNISELAVALLGKKESEKFAAQIQRYETEKSAIKLQAEKLENESKEWNEKSDHAMHLHHRWAQATTLLQVSIALAAISLLSRNEWLKKAMYVVGVMGLLTGVLAAFHI
jgi:hypothetical protein